MQKLIIPIVYASDENFLKQTYVSIYSVLTNRAGDYQLKFYILVPENCDEKKYNEKWLFSDYSIEYIFVSQDYFQNVKMLMQHITKPTYYRLLISLILTKYDKCLYLDGDTICLCDIRELYEIEIENNLLAAAMGAVIPFDAQYKEKVLNLPNAKHYINAGVLIMNLKQMRLENKIEEFLKYSEMEFPCQDQDVLNICCYNRIRLLPLKYNIYNTAFNMSEEMLLERYEKREIQDALSNPAIIHYPGEYAKPWNNLRCVKGKEWWNYASSIFNQRVISEIQSKALKQIKSYDYKNLFEQIGKCEQLVIFGFSEIGQKFCNQINEKFPGKVVCFCDNAKEKWGKLYKGYEVINLSNIIRKFPNAFIVITSQRYSNEIYKQLIEQGINPNNILIYRQKTMKYIYSMDKIYWEETKADIRLDSISWEECKNGYESFSDYSCL